MNALELKEALGPLWIGHGFSGQWDPDELVGPLVSLDEDVQREILAQVRVIWPVSQALTFVFLDTIQEALRCLAPQQIPQWVGTLLDSYEAGGLAGARRLVADIERNFVCRVRGETGLLFEAAAGRLTAFSRGLTGRDIHLAASDPVRTDASTVYVPDVVDLYLEEENNFLVYRLIIAWQWAYLNFGTIRPGLQTEKKILASLPPGDRDPEMRDSAYWLDRVLACFKDRQLALETYHLLETARLLPVLKAELPGLVRDTEDIGAQLLDRRPAVPKPDERGRVLEGMRQWILGGTSPELPSGPSGEALKCALVELRFLSQPGRSVLDSVEGLFRLYPCMETLAGTEVGPPLLFQGRFKTSEILQAILSRRNEAKRLFVQSMAAILAAANPKTDDSSGDSAHESPRTTLIEEDAVALSILPATDENSRSVGGKNETIRFIELDASGLEIPEEMSGLVREIRDDLGEIPSEYLSAAHGLAGHSGGNFNGPETDRGEEASGESVYPEWDFRRQGFRKNWCRVLERNLDPVGGSFVGDTLDKHRGLINQLKRQFEMIRTQDRFLKRQRDGDEVDLDAMVEALSDIKAGIEPSERLFIRLIRDQRSIAAAFLVDMSASTEGWISTAIKEALVLLCEALDVLGDRYAIFGFSGMRRTRSELYRIKTFEEPYSATVKSRIAAVSARDYTRMGPPIRHLTRLLHNVDARVRLIITLSDGKPEDYDDYKGRYAVEDTRHALIEARAAGMHPFCITIDQSAQEYISHMFGEVNYIFIDDVRKLPLRTPEIYRALTT